MEKKIITTLMVKSIDWIFFDIGGVLTDESRYQDYRRATCMTIAQKFLPSITSQEYETSYALASLGHGSLTENTIRQLLITTSLEVQEAALLLLKKDYRGGPTYVELEDVRPEAKIVLTKLAANYKLGVIANQPSEISEKFTAAGIFDLFSSFIVSPDATGKPHLEYYRHVLEVSGAKAEHSVVVDDNYERGILPAKELGMTTVHFATTSLLEGVDYFAENLQDLVTLFP